MGIGREHFIGCLMATPFHYFGFVSANCHADQTFESFPRKPVYFESLHSDPIAMRLSLKSARKLNLKINIVSHRLHVHCHPAFDWPHRLQHADIVNYDVINDRMR